ncbi:MAG: DNA polymerase III subunit delta' C-terminal domain-containing protein [Nitrospira sp.]|nr:DNA polymerase III subunit delta' C-terminal domain-containing protein [Nitrospira sp.]
MRFSELKGQDRAIKILKRAISGGHIAQTYLFYGPDGVGKKEAAINFAKAVNCHAYADYPESPQFKDDACDACISCRKINQGIHPDVKLITTEKGEIKIGVIREIISGMAYRPLEARKRVVIVDEADKFNISSSNAFLKTLEEPPSDTIIILVTASPDMLPATVLSRSQKISFGNIPRQIIIDILVNKFGISADAAEFASYIANGSISRAISFSASEIHKIREDVIRVLAEINRNTSALFDLSDKYSKDENNFYDALYWIFTYFRDALILKSRCNSTYLINKDLHGHLLKIKERMTIEGLLYIMDFIKAIYKGQERNMNKQLALDAAGTKIMEVIGDTTWK